MPAGLTAMQAVAAARRLPPRPQRHNTECIGPREGSGGPPMSRSSILGMGRELCQAAAAAGGTQRPEMATPWRQRRAAELLWQLQAAARVRAAQHVTAVACLTRRQRGRLTRRACKRNGSQDPRRAGGLRGVIRAIYGRSIATREAGKHPGQIPPAGDDGGGGVHAFMSGDGCKSNRPLARPVMQARGRMDIRWLLLLAH